MQRSCLSAADKRSRAGPEEYYDPFLCVARRLHPAMLASATGIWPLLSVCLTSTMEMVQTLHI